MVNTVGRMVSFCRSDVNFSRSDGQFLLVVSMVKQVGGPTFVGMMVNFCRLDDQLL